MANDASRGVGNSSAQTVGDHALVNERTRKRSAAGGMKRSASLCGRGCRSAGAVAWSFSAGAGDTIERQLPAGKAHSTIGKQLPPGKAQSTIGKQLHSAKQGTFGTSNLPNQQHRDEQPVEPAASGGATCRTSSIATSNQSNRSIATRILRTSSIGKSTFCQIMVPKGQVLRGVRGSNLACFLKNFVSNYIVIFLMMLFRVHL